MDISAGKILIGEPFLLDPNFKRTVILICEHNKVGTTGFILNKPLNIKMEDLIAGFPETNAAVHVGGPVAVDSIHYLHDCGDILNESIEVCPGVFWGGNFEQLKFLMENKLITEKNIRFYVGYSGWTENQLEEEIQEGTWILDEMDPNYLFKIKPFILWQSALNNKGNAFTVIAQMPDTISLN
jgi:putative transcriptional regulator